MLSKDSQADLKDEDNAILCLIKELEDGIRSADEEGWISEEQLRDHFKSKIVNRG